MLIVSKQSVFTYFLNRRDLVLRFSQVTNQSL